MTASSLGRFLAALALGINVKAADGASRRELRALTVPAVALFDS
jgi:hypothetical protein